MAQRLSLVPEFLREIVEVAKEKLSLNRAWIYGSRSRGDHNLWSDYDLAFEFPVEKQLDWLRFKSYFEDQAELWLNMLEDRNLTSHTYTDWSREQ